MSDIILPYPTFSDGTISDATQVGQNIYDTPNTPNSFEVINGSMDFSNHTGPGVFKLDRKAVQRGSFSGGKSIGADCNVDYFGITFADYTNSVEDDDYYKAIPGGAVSFYLPYAPSLVVFTWNVFMTNGLINAGNVGGTDSIISRVRLFVNGTSIPHQVLPLPEADGGFPVGEFIRRWQGHYVQTGLSAGWHSVSLRIVVNQAPDNHVRVYARSLDYVYFR